MVQRKIAEETKEKGILKIHPNKLSEITESKYKKFVIKIEANYCGPCQEMNAFIDSIKDKEDVFVPMYVLQIDEEPPKDFVKMLCRQVGCQSIPYCYVTNKELEKIDVLSGFNREKFTEFIKKHFSNK